MTRPDFRVKMTKAQLKSISNIRFVRGLNEEGVKRLVKDLTNVLPLYFRVRLYKDLVITKGRTESVSLPCGTGIVCVRADSDYVANGCSPEEAFELYSTGLSERGRVDINGLRFIIDGGVNIGEVDLMRDIRGQINYFIN